MCVKKNPSPTVKKNPALKSDLYESGGCNKYLLWLENLYMMILIQIILKIS